MTLSEILSGIQQVVDWGVSGGRALLEALGQLFGELWVSIVRSVMPGLPVLSSSQRDALVTVAVVVGGAVAVFLLVQMWLLLVRRPTPRRPV